MTVPATVLDHRVTAWRYTESRGAFRETLRGWGKIPGLEDFGMKVTVTRERVEDSGGGERTGGEYSGLCDFVELVEGDVIELVEGAEAPATLKVDEAYHPVRDHTELVLVPWVGDLSQ